jgi:hypothetical protein
LRLGHVFKLPDFEKQQEKQMNYYKKFRMPDEPEYEDIEESDPMDFLYTYPNDSKFTPERGTEIAKDLEISDSAFLDLVFKGYLVEVAEGGL